MQSNVKETIDTEVKMSYLINLNSLRTNVAIENGTSEAEAVMKQNLFDVNSGNIELQKIMFTAPDRVDVTYDMVNKQALDVIKSLIIGNTVDAIFTIKAEMRATVGANYFGSLTLVPNKRIRYRDSKLTMSYRVVSKLLIAVN